MSGHMELTPTEKLKELGEARHFVLRANEIINWLGFGEMEIVGAPNLTLNAELSRAIEAIDNAMKTIQGAMPPPTISR